MSERFRVSSVGDGGSRTNYGATEHDDFDGKGSSSVATSPVGGGGDGDSLASVIAADDDLQSAPPLSFGMANGN